MHEMNFECPIELYAILTDSKKKLWRDLLAKPIHYPILHWLHYRTEILITVSKSYNFHTIHHTTKVCRRYLKTSKCHADNNVDAFGIWTKPIIPHFGGETVHLPTYMYLPKSKMWSWIWLYQSILFFTDFSFKMSELLSKFHKFYPLEKGYGFFHRLPLQCWSHSGNLPLLGDLSCHSVHDLADLCHFFLQNKWLRA